MDAHIAFLQVLDSVTFSVAELARRHNVSRETIYDWKRRRARRAR